MVFMRRIGSIPSFEFTITGGHFMITTPCRFPTLVTHPPSHGRERREDNEVAHSLPLIAAAIAGRSYVCLLTLAHGKGVVDTPLEPPVAGEITSPCVP